MEDDTRNQALQKAILEWRQKHRIAEDDPCLALLELWEIYFQSCRHDSAEKPTLLPFQEFRYSVQHLERLSRAIAKQASELIQEVRAVPKREKAGCWRPVSLALAVFLAGILIGKLLL